jgi:lipid-A-disaccharide synthase
MRYYLIAGERSGDLHGGNLVKSLKQYDNNAEFSGFGGDRMSEEGVSLTLHYKHLAFMGFFEVLKNLFKISGYLKLCKRDILKFKPDVVVLIDYGGFNLKMASFLKKNNIKTYYYITPKVWAWNQGRAWKIKRLIDRMFVILPFEKDFYKNYDWEVDYVGNPVLDAIKSHEQKDLPLGNENKEVIAVLPGSRKQEVINVINLLPAVIKGNPDLYFVIATVDNLDDSLYDPVIGFSNVELIQGRTYDLLLKAKAAIVTSGTATLETALLKVPQVVIYKTSSISYHIGKRLIKVGYISLVNLIADKPVVKELIQNDLNEANLKKELNELVSNDQHRTQIISDYKEIYQTLDVGSASDNTARLIVNYLKE